MDTPALLVDGFGRVHEGVTDLLDGTDDDQLSRRPGPRANPVGWLVWHLIRVQDSSLADLAGTDEVWADGWYERSGLDLDREDTGYGHSTDQVASVRVGADVLRGYLDAVHARTVAVLEAMTPAELDRVVDTSYDPPVTAGQRLVSVLADDLQHVGQAAYVRGLLQNG